METTRPEQHTTERPLVDYPTQALPEPITAPPRTSSDPPDYPQKEKNAGVDVEDIEKGGISDSPSQSEQQPQVDPTEVKTRNFYHKYRIYIHLAIFALFTGWWIAGLVLHRDDKNWVVPFLLWLAISLRLLFCYIPIKIISRPMKWTWQQTGSRIAAMIPDKLRIPAAALLVVAVIIVGSFVSEETQDNTRENRAVSLFGLVVLIFGFWATSKHRKNINWHTVIVGMLMQFVIALFVLRTGVGYDIFNFISGLATELLGFAKEGVAFLTTEDIAANTFFFFSVLPAIIFFVALVSMLYHWGVLQWFIGKFAVFFFWAMRISGAESVVASATPFIGQGESAMLIKPFVPYLTTAELHQVMASGFATIAGSVLVAYIGMGVNPQVLISSCVMSIPASIAMSKLRYPEVEESLSAGKVVVPNDENRSANTLHAFANGAWLGLKIAGMIMATLLCIIALLGLVNGLLTWWGRYLNLNGEYDLTIELILGYVFYPVAFLLGVPRGPDLLRVARLIGVKVIAVSCAPFPLDVQVGHILTFLRRTSSSPTTCSPPWPTTRRCLHAAPSSPPTRSAASATSAPSAPRSVCSRKSLPAVPATSASWPSARSSPVCLAR